MQLKRTTEGIWGQSPEPLGDFRDFAEKISILTPFQSLFVRFCTYMNNYNKLLELEFIKRIKLLGPSASLMLKIKFKTRLIASKFKCALKKQKQLVFKKMFLRIVSGHNH